MNKPAPEPSQSERCDVCRGIVLLDYRTPFSVDGKFVNGKLVNGKTLYDGTAELIRSAKDGCDLCQVMLQSLIYQCSSEQQEWNMRTFQGSVKVYFHAEYLELDLSYFMSAKIYYTTTVSKDTLGELKPEHTERSQLIVPGSDHGQERNMVFARPISKDPISPSVFSLAASWLSECAEQHACDPPIKCGLAPTLPTRVIHVGERNSSDAHLMVSEGRRGSYFVLSYCWGLGLHPHRLIKQTLEAYKRRIPTANLPKTILDAIVITRQLGYYYIWIDALCIIQDDFEDWRRESARMADIYGNAFCTISATGARESATGCFPKRTGLTYPVAPCTISGTKADGEPYERTLLPAVPEWDVAVLKAPINDRLWTLQERALSHRILHWTKHELFWECRTKKASETWAGGISRTGDDDGSNPSTFWEFKQDEAGMLSIRAEAPVGLQVLARMPGFRQNLKEYWHLIAVEASRRTLTVESDILPALSGLASLFQSQPQNVYLAGLWRSHMPQSLFWRVLNTTKKPLPEKHRPKSFSAPTWSWISVVGEISFPNGQELSAACYLPDVEVLDAKVSLINEADLFGQVSGGTLRIAGVLSRKLTAIHFYGTTGYYFKTLIRESVNESELKPSRRPLGSGTGIEVIYDITPPCLGRRPETPPKALVLLRVYKADAKASLRIKAIALEKVDWTLNKFRRVGWVDDCDESWFHSQNRSIIKIV